MIFSIWNGTWNDVPVLVNNKDRFGFKTVLAIWCENIVSLVLGIPMAIYILLFLGFAHLIDKIKRKK
jgi:hypothetical protein